MVVTNKRSSEIQEICEGRSGDLFFIHLLGCLQSHVIASDEVTEAKVAELFKNIYPSNLNGMSTGNVAVDVEELRFLVKTPSDGNIYKKNSEDGTLLSKKGTVQFLEKELSKLDKSNVAVMSSSLCSPHLLFGVPVIEIHFFSCIGQPLGSKSQNISENSSQSDQIIKVDAPLLVETKLKCTKDGAKSKLTSFQVPVDILHKTCNLDDLKREHLIKLIRDQLTTLESTVVQLNKHFKSGTRNKIPLLAKPYHFPTNLWSTLPPNPPPFQSANQKSSKMVNEVEIVTEFLPFQQQMQMMTSEEQYSVELQAWRQLLHDKHKVSENDKRPLFRAQNAITFKPIFDTQVVFDECSVPEVNLMAESAISPTHMPPRVKYETVKGRYAYFHYGQDGLNDSGWGCAYRSLQTVWSWFLIQGYTDKPVISHRAIQETLHKIGDKPVSFVGSNKWIGSFEVSYVLDHHLDIVCAFINVQSGDQLVSHLDRIANHFVTHGTPIMVGGGVLAHTICGIAFDELAPESTVRYLILDPHYIGVDDLKTIKKKSGFAWKPQSFWKSNAYYNICLPQRPKVI